MTDTAQRPGTAARHFIREFLSLGGRRPDWLTGLRALLGFGVPLVIGMVFDFTPLALTASVIAAITVSLADQSDSPVENLVTTLILSLTTSLLLGLGAMTTRWGAAAVLYMTVVAFVSAFLPLLGRVGIVAAAISPIAALFAVATADQSAPPELWQLFLLPIPAGLWATLIVAVTWRMQTQPVVRAVRAAYAAQAELNRTYAEVLRVDPTSPVDAGKDPSELDDQLKESRRRGSVAIEQALTLTTPRGVWGPDLRRRARGRQLMSELIGVSVSARGLFHDALRVSRDDPSREAAAATLVGSAARLQARSRGASAPHALPPLPSVDCEAGEPVCQAIGTLQLRMELPPEVAQWAQRLWDEPSLRDRLVQNLRMSSPVLRYATRFAVAAALGTGVVMFTDWPHREWFLLTIIVGLKPMMGAANHRFLQRIIGTLVGAVVGTALAYLLAGESAIDAVLASILIGVGLAFMTINYFYWVVCLTPALLLLYAAMAPPTIATPGLRVAFTLLGGLVAFLVNIWILPNRARVLAPVALSKAVSSLADYVTAVFTTGTSTATMMKEHRKCVLSTNSALDMISAEADEPRAARHLPDAYPDVVGACEGLRDAVGLIVSRPDQLAAARENTAEVAAGFRTELEQIAAAIARGDAASEVTTPTDLPPVLAEVGQAVETLRDSVPAWETARSEAA